MKKFISLSSHYIRVLKHRTKTVVAVRIAIRVVEIEGTRIRSVIVIAPTFEPRIASVQELQFNPYISHRLIEIPFSIPSPLSNFDGDRTKSYHHLSLSIYFLSIYFMASLRILFTFFQKRAKAEKCNFTTGLKPCIHNKHRTKTVDAVWIAIRVAEMEGTRTRSVIALAPTSEPRTASFRHVRIIGKP